MFSEQQLQYLIHNYHDHTLKELIEGMSQFGKVEHPGTVRYHLRKLGLNTKHSPWNKQVVQFMKDNYPDGEEQDIIDGLAKLGIIRSWRQIVHWASHNRIHRSSHRTGAKKAEAKNRSFEKARMRIKYGMDPGINVRNFGRPLDIRAARMRFRMKSKHGYIIIKFDHNIYYDDNTQRSPELESKYRELAEDVLHISTAINE